MLALAGVASATGCRQTAGTAPAPPTTLPDRTVQRGAAHRPGAPADTGPVATIRADTLQQRVLDRLAQFGVPITRVSCPDDVPAVSGVKFSCLVEFAGRRTYGLDGTIQDISRVREKGAANFVWHDGLAVRVAALTQAMHDTLVANLTVPMTVDCGDEPLRFLDAERKLTCTVTAGDARSTLTMEFDEHVNLGPWRLDPVLVVPSRIVQILTPMVRAKTNPRVELDCGPRLAYPRPSDGIVWCTVKDGSQRAKLKAAVDANLDLQHWWIVGPATAPL